MQRTRDFVPPADSGVARVVFFLSDTTRPLFHLLSLRFESPFCLRITKFSIRQFFFFGFVVVVVLFVDFNRGALLQNGKEKRETKNRQVVDP